jgi:predicted nucleic-acid-binding protein
MSALAGSLDTNVLLRLLLKDLPEQHQAIVALLDSSPGSFEVADTAVIEIVFVLERNYSFTRDAIAEDVGGLITLPRLNSNRVLFERALPLFVAHPSLSFEDCCLSVYAELQAATPLWTFDKKLATQTPSARLVPSKQSQRVNGGS